MYFQPATQRSDAIIRPICKKCGTRMMLARIEPDHPGYERRTFECSKCEHAETIIAKSEPTAPGPNRATWRIGQRVARKDTKELGIVSETDGKIKVKWDNGKTSYYRHGEAANVELEPV